MGYSEISWRQMPHKKNRSRSKRKSEEKIEDVKLPNGKGKKNKKPTQSSDVSIGSEQE